MFVRPHIRLRESHCRRTNDFEGASFRHSVSGFMLFTVIGILLVMSIFFIAMSTLSRGQIQGANHFLDASRAIGLAEAGARWGMTVVSQGGIEEKYQDRNINKEFYETLFDKSKSESPKMQIGIPRDLENYINSLGGNLEIWVKLDDLKTIPPMGGFQEDPRERIGKITVEATAIVNKVSRKYTIIKGIKTFLMVHPMLAKFTLFVREKHENDDVNSLIHSTAGTYGLPSGGNALPIEILNCADPVNVIEPALDLAKVPEPSKFIETNGWIFLNSDDSDKPWNINLSGSTLDGVYDDRVLLRFGAYNKNQDFANTFLHASRQPSPHKFTAIHEKFDGFKKDYTIFSGTSTIISHRFLDVRFLFDEEGIPPKTSIIRLFGNGREFTPTLVFGPVNMRYVRFRAMDLQLALNDPDCGKTFPPPTELFDAGIPGYGDLKTGTKAIQRFKYYFRNPPQEPRDYTKDYGVYRDLFRIPREENMPEKPEDEDKYFNDAWAEYEKLMTNIATAPFIDSIVYMKLEPEGGTPKDPVSKEYDTSNDPFEKADYLNNISLFTGSVTRDSIREAKNISFNRIRPEGGVIAYDKPLIEVDAKAIQNKFTAVFNKYAEFTSDNLSGDLLNVGGIIYTGEDGITIDKPLTIASGGILVTGGDIVLKASITTGEKEVLTLITSKNIRIETESEIKAHLICLNGTFSGSAFNVTGGIAAGKLDLRGMVNDRVKRVIFNRDADPLVCNMHLYRFKVSKDEEVSIAPGQ